MIVRIAAVAAALSVATPVLAASLNPADPGDRLVIASHQCNEGMNATNFAASAIPACDEAHRRATQALTASPPLTAVQRNKAQVARAMTTISVLSSYAKSDGVISRRICARLAALKEMLDAYRADLTPDWDGFHAKLRATHADMAGKCR